MIIDTIIYQVDIFDRHKEEEDYQQRLEIEGDILCRRS